MDATLPLNRAVNIDGTDTQSLAARIGWYLILIAIAIPLTAFHRAATPVWKWAAPQLMVDLEAASPFQQRILMPAIVGMIERNWPQLGLDLLFGIAEVATWVLLVVVAHQGLKTFRLGPPGLGRRLLAMTIIVPIAMHVIVPDLRVFSILSSEGGDIGLGDWKLVPYFRYVYDLPAAIFILGLVILLKRFVERPDRGRFLAYLGLFALATTNRETTLFMLPAFLVVCFGKLNLRTLALCLVVQLAVFAAVHGGIKLIAPGVENLNARIPATSYENHWRNNLRLFTDPLYLLSYLVRFGAALYLPVILLHRHLDPVLKRTLIAFGIPFLASAVLVGRLVEHRVVIEFIPILWLAAVQVIIAALDEENRQRLAGGPRPVPHPFARRHLRHALTGPVRRPVSRLQRPDVAAMLGPKAYRRAPDRMPDGHIPYRLPPASGIQFL